MLNEPKYRIRKKIINSVEEGTTSLNSKIDNFNYSMNHQIAELTTSLNKLSDRIYALENKPLSYEYVSPEYILDSIQFTHSKKPRLLICGFYGALNLGDELMLQALLRRLDHNKFDTTIMIAEHPEIDASIYAPHQVIHYPKFNDDILLLAKNYDCIIWGGGAVLDDDQYYFNYSHNSLGYILLKTSLAALKFRKKIFVLGTSTNQSIQDKSFIKDLQAVISNANYFALRDTNSLKVLQNNNINVKNIHIIDDLAISDLPNSIPQKKSKTLTIGLVFILDDNNLPNIITFIQTIIKYFKNEDVILNFIPFYNRAGYDQKYFQRIISSIKTQKNINTNIKPYPNTSNELIQIISQCNCIISMRYHATLISSLCGIKTLSIDYSEEHRHYYNKLTYIHDNYANFHKILFSKITDEKSVFNSIKQTLNTPPHIFDPRVIKKADNSLSKITNQINLLF